MFPAGAAYVGSFVNLMRDSGFWSFPRGQGLLDGGVFPEILTASKCFSDASFVLIRSPLLHNIHVRRWRFGGCWCHRGTGSSALPRCLTWCSFMILQFYRALLQGLGCQDRIAASHQMDSSKCGSWLLTAVALRRIVAFLFIVRADGIRLAKFLLPSSSKRHKQNGPKCLTALMLALHQC